MTDDEDRIDFLDQLDSDVDIVESAADDSIESDVDSADADRLLAADDAANVRSHIDQETRLASNERAAARRRDQQPTDTEKADSARRRATLGVDDPGIPESIDPDDPIPVIEPHIHEVNAHLLFTEENYDAFGDDDVSDLSDGEVLQRHDDDAISPYWAIVSQWEEHSVLEQRYGTFDALGDEWEFIDGDEDGGVKFWEGKLAARGQSFDAFNEYQIGIRAIDQVAERKISLQFRPALPVATHSETGDQIGNMPRDMPYGVRVQIGSSNVGPQDALEVLRALADHLDINPDYFADDRIHSWSRAFGVGMYVRLDRDIGERKLVGRGALIDRLARFGSTTEGSTGEYHWDNEDVMGHRTAVTLDNVAWKKLLPDNHFAKLLKYYHPFFARGESTSSDDDPLADPKLEMQFSNEHNPEGSVPWRSDDVLDFQDLIQEMEDALINTLDWANVSTRADDRVYTADEYWEPTESVRDHVEIVPDPMPRVEAHENAAALRQFAQGGPSPDQRGVVSAVADGGSAQHWRDVADRADVSKSTVYRAVDNFDDILRVENGRVGFEDGVVRDRIDELLGSFNNAMEWVRGKAGQLADQAQRFADASSALGRWARRHLAHIEETADGLLVDLTGRPLAERHLEELLRAGFEAAYQDGTSAARTFVDDTRFRWSAAERDGAVRESKNVVLEEAGRVKICGNKRASFGTTRSATPR
ncbi:TetR/AcrR family transcriptional regulator [Halobaculum sp. P14]|uniref:TetR/AcrR family transcriptional regulator n=1 Tax=Halobaculum sp. P14 TaxID=3421638 RepID=UPI003EBF7D9A